MGEEVGYRDSPTINDMAAGRGGQPGTVARFEWDRELKICAKVFFIALPPIGNEVGRQGFRWGAYFPLQFVNQ